MDEMNVRMAGWKQANDKGTYVSLNVEVMPAEEKQTPVQAQPVPPQEDFDDDIPF